MKFGLTLKQIDIIEKILISQLREKSVSIYIFGSRATGKNHPYSDLDILLENSDHLTFSDLSLLKDQLEESSLPFKVDLILSRNLASSYRSHVEKEKVQW